MADDRLRILWPRTEFFSLIIYNINSHDFENRKTEFQEF